MGTANQLIQDRIAKLKQQVYQATRDKEKLSQQCAASSKIKHNALKMLQIAREDGAKQ